MLKKMWFLFVLAGILTGCATVHRVQEQGVSYTDLYMGNNTYVMVASVGGDVAEAGAYDYFQRRAIEIMRKKGYCSFETIEKGSNRRYSISTKQFIESKIANVPAPYVYSRVKFNR